MKKLLSISLVLAMAVLILGCPKQEIRKPQGEMDNPLHHVRTGDRLLGDENDVDGALREYNLALQLDPKYSTAHGGVAVCMAMKGDADKAKSHLAKANKYAKDDSTKVLYRVAGIRVYTALKSKNWLRSAEKHHAEALRLNKNSEEAHFYMGNANLAAYKFGSARDEYRKVVNLKGKLKFNADKKWALCDKIERAAPESAYGKRIAIVEKMTRADVAGLFIEELHLKELWQKRTKKKFDTSFKVPGKEFKTTVKVEAMTDIANHPLRTDIEIVTGIGIKGLEPFPDHTFKPNETISRSEYAIMLVDIIAKINGDSGLLKEFIGSKSPHPDLRGDEFYFSAVMVCTSRNIMVVKDMSSGEFAPLDPVAGADALLALRKIKTLYPTFNP